uniref:Epiphycan n=1 Tax=Sphaeramia orbicularis TaxID=375764 RepID=A0A673B3T7_9TELE
SPEQFQLSSSKIIIVFVVVFVLTNIMLITCNFINTQKPLSFNFHHQLNVICFNTANILFNLISIIAATSGLLLAKPAVLFPRMPTCLLCTCLGGSVYCDDLKLDHVPPLPKETTHFYARYNRITKINKSDFAFMNKLKRIDLTANEITSIDEKAFIGLPELEELVIRENHISQLPALPETMALIDASHNNIGTKGIHKEAFKDMTSLLYLYLTDNNLDYIPVPLPDSLRSLHLQRNNIQMMHEDTFCNLKDFNYIRNALEDIRLDGNPINLSRTPQAYICLPRIPIGDLI